MRFVVLSVLAAMTVAACDQKPPAAPAAPVAPPTATPAPTAAADAGDANAMTPAQIAEKLVGKFVSNDDPKSTLEVTAGKWIQSYDGKVVDTSNWRVFPGTEPPKTSANTFTPASRYLEVSVEGEEPFFYEMGRIDQDGFDMFYVGRGNTLSYKRIK